MTARKAELAEAPARRANGRVALDEARPLTNPRKELVREQLIDIAAKIFDEKGYAQTGMGEIAQELGLGRSAVYHYFRNKEEILAALVEAEALTPSNLLDELSQNRDLTASERLRTAVTDGIVRRLSSGSRFLFFTRLEAQIPAHMSALYNQSRRHIYDFYVKCISDGMAAGEFREVDPKIAAFAVIGAANWTSRWYSPNGPKSPREIAEVIADFAMQGLRKVDAAGTDLAGLRATVAALREQIDSLEQLLP